MLKLIFEKRCIGVHIPNWAESLMGLNTCFFSIITVDLYFHDKFTYSIAWVQYIERLM